MTKPTRRQNSKFRTTNSEIRTVLTSEFELQHLKFVRAALKRWSGIRSGSTDSQTPFQNSLPFEDRRQALSYPDAERRDAARGAGASHLVDQRRGQAGAAATKRVTDRNRAAVDVQFCVVARAVISIYYIQLAPSDSTLISLPARSAGVSHFAKYDMRTRRRSWNFELS